MVAKHVDHHIIILTCDSSREYTASRDSRHQRPMQPRKEEAAKENRWLDKWMDDYLIRGKYSYLDVIQKRIKKAKQSESLVKLPQNCKMGKTTNVVWQIYTKIQKKKKNNNLRLKVIYEPWRHKAVKDYILYFNIPSIIYICSC